MTQHARHGLHRPHLCSVFWPVATTLVRTMRSFYLKIKYHRHSCIVFATSTSSSFCHVIKSFCLYLFFFLLLFFFVFRVAQKHMADAQRGQVRKQHILYSKFIRMVHDSYTFSLKTVKHIQGMWYNPKNKHSLWKFRHISTQPMSMLHD